MISTTSFAYAQVDILNDIEFLQTGTINTSENEFSISNDVTIREFFNGNIVRVSGQTIEGFPYITYSKILDEKIEIRGMIFENGQFADLVFSKENKSEENDIEEDIPNEKIEIHVLIEQFEVVNNNENYKLFVKTFDKSVYSGNDFNKFQGKLSGAKVSVTITDPNNEVKEKITGIVENGLYEGTVKVVENLWMRGWYVVDVTIEYEGQTHTEQLTFYVTGKVDSGNDLSCPEGQTKQNGSCV